MNLKSLGAACALALASAAAVNAYAWPDKPVTVIVPFAAGGPTDTLARTFAQSMQKTFKQSVVVENVGGAGGNIGITRVARANPDGYTLLLMHIGLSTSPALYRTLQYNPITDLEPIGLVADVPMTLIAKQAMPAKTFPELLAYLKANKEKVTMGNAGLGSASHLCGLLFQSAIETELTTVPYKGTAPAMNDLLGGQIDLMCDQTTNTTSQIKSGKVKAYGVTTLTRVASLPELPTLNEAGLKGFQVAVWHGLYAPKGTPKPVIDAAVSALQEAIKDPLVKQRLAELGTEPVAADRARPEALRTFLKAEIDKWGPIIKKAGVYAD